jgi:CubicO group peptidase (beta-lactamase class C family)
MAIFRTVAAPLLLALAWPALAQSAPLQPRAEASVATILPAIEAHFRQFVEEAHIPGLVFGIVRDGRLVHVGTMGVQDLDQRRPVTADSLFRIASMSKAFTALAILKLRDENRLSLDALAETYVPELRNWRYPTSDSPRIRVRNLLSHTAGLVTDDPWGDRQQVLSEGDFTRMIEAGVPMSRTPGLAMEYSNFGYALLGRIITNVSGQPYDRYIRSQILLPLGMTSTVYEIANSPPQRRAIGYRWEDDRFVREPDMRHGAFGAMGGIETSANDYARWVAFLLSAWPARDGPEAGPVRRSSVRELAQGLNFIAMAERAGLGDAPACRYPRAYGMGMRVFQDCDLGLILTHGGGYPGYGSNVVLLPESGVGIFAFANRTYAGPSRPVIASALELQLAGLIRPRSTPVSADLASSYRLAGDIYRAGSVTSAGEGLAMNFLMDRSAEHWSRDLETLKSQLGACQTQGPIVPDSAMSGRFSWICERGTLGGFLLLAPTRPTTIQRLTFTIVAPR